jgi:hypothetical protein
MMTVQKHHALDWLIGNHDAHERQFIRSPEHGLVGIDKGQAFKYFNHDRLDWNYHPNTKYQEHEPVANTVYRNFAKGGRDERRLGEVLAGKQPVNVDVLRRLPIQPEHKRIFLAVVAKAHPEHAKELLDLARKLDFQRDVTSMCLRKVLE